jgi:uncharacterized protein
MIEKLKPKIEKYFRCTSHDFFHTQRVYNLVIKIAEKEKADLEIVKAAALLHDIGRDKEEKDQTLCHAEESAKMAPEILRSINFPENKIDAVLHCIKVHRYSKGLESKTKEAEILQDADRLDALGAICIARVFTYGGQMKRPIYNPKIKPKKRYNPKSGVTSINHFYEKILKIKPETFKTKMARKIAQERYKYIENFIERFKKEWDGLL